MFGDRLTCFYGTNRLLCHSIAILNALYTLSISQSVVKWNQIYIQSDFYRIWFFIVNELELKQRLHKRGVCTKIFLRCYSFVLIVTSFLQFTQLLSVRKCYIQGKHRWYHPMRNASLIFSKFIYFLMVRSMLLVHLSEKSSCYLPIIWWWRIVSLHLSEKSAWYLPIMWGWRIVSLHLSEKSACYLPIMWGVTHGIPEPVIIVS